MGTYVTKTDTSVTYAVFEWGGTGLFVESAETDKDAGMLQGTFNWTAAEPKKTYTLALADGTAETASLDAARGILTIKEVVFEKYPSGLSGRAIEVVGSVFKGNEASTYGGALHLDELNGEEAAWSLMTSPVLLEEQQKALSAGGLAVIEMLNGSEGAAVDLQ